jgi:hypothetical protein
MGKRFIATGLIAAAIAGAGGLAFAADMSVKAPRGAVSQMSSSGFYLWVDGSYQSVSLPDYAAGLIRADFGTGTPIGPLDRFKVRLDGFGVSGAAGYVFRDGTFAPFWGSNVRLEIGGSYIDADARQNASGSFDAVAYQMLSGFLNSGLACIGPCSYATQLDTDYRQTHITLKAASDFRQPGLTLSPSLEIFGGGSRTNQTLTTMQTLIGATSPLYQAQTVLKWQDWGARLGLDGTVDLSSWLAFGLGGKIGFAIRDVDFSGSDLITNGFGIVSATSTISRNADTTALIANAEARLTARLAPQFTIRTFAGLTYDSRVPGIAPASYSGSYAPPRMANPAGIAFSGETSYYAGGGLTIAFVP